MVSIMRWKIYYILVLALTASLLVFFAPAIIVYGSAGLVQLILIITGYNGNPPSPSTLFDTKLWMAISGVASILTLVTITGTILIINLKRIHYLYIITESLTLISLIYITYSILNSPTIKTIITESLSSFSFILNSIITLRLITTIKTHSSIYLNPVSER